MQIGWVEPGRAFQLGHVEYGQLAAVKGDQAFIAETLQGPIDAACVDAINNARAIMAAELASRGEINLSHWIELENDEGEIVVVQFRDAVLIHP